MLAEDGGLTDEHRASIEAALPDGVTMTEEAWADLTEIVDAYHLFKRRRTTYPIAEERKRWKRLGDAADKTSAELRQLAAEKGSAPWLDRALAALEEVSRKVEARAAFHFTWSAFGRRQNPHREFLFGGIMRVWTDRLGGELHFSRPPRGGLPSGPLVRFLQACLEPVLGDDAPAEGIADIIERERRARAWTENQKRIETEKRRRSGQH
jgi:hypothetical protein